VSFLLINIWFLLVLSFILFEWEEYLFDVLFIVWFEWICSIGMTKTIDAFIVSLVIGFDMSSLWMSSIILVKEDFIQLCIEVRLSFFVWHLMYISESQSDWYYSLTQDYSLIVQLCLQVVQRLWYQLYRAVWLKQHWNI